MSLLRARRVATAAVACLAATLAACSGDGTDNGDGGGLKVVAGTNSWGDIAAQIGGDAVTVTSIVSDSGIDPHEYEADVDDAAAIADARIVIENGLAYDGFVDRLVDAGHRDDLSVLNVADLVGAADGDNPHLWYHPDYVRQVAQEIEAQLAKADPANAETYQANLATFLRGQQKVADAVAVIKSRYAGTAVAYTEPVAGYLVEAAGLTLGMPEAFAKSQEEGTDPSPIDVAAFEKALQTARVKALLYNSQVTDPVTDHLRDVAESSGVPVVGVTENLPKGKNFQTWQADQAQALLEALGG